MARLRPSEIADQYQIKSCFVFMVSPPPLEAKETKPFRDPSAPNVLAKLANSLKADGLHVSEPKPGIACDAAFQVKFSDFTVTVVTFVHKVPGGKEFGIMTWCHGRAFRRVSPDVAAERWMRVCARIARTLSDDPTVTCSSQMTPSEAGAQWSRWSHS
jgi:hypothetical protein